MGIGKYLKAQPGMKEIKFTNKDQAMKDFRERMGDQQGLLDAINGNPLPASYQMSFQTPEQLKTAAEVVAKYQGVETVQYGKDIIEQLYKVAQIIRLSGIVLIIFLAGAELFIISNTIRLTVFCQKKRDPDHEVRRCLQWLHSLAFPFRRHGHRFFRLRIASLILWEGYKTVVSEMAAAGLVFIPMIPLWPFMGYTTLIILAAGIVIGVMGSAISLRKYMKV